MWADKDLHPIQYFQLLTYSSGSGNGESVNRILEIGLPGFSKLTSLLAYCVTWKPLRRTHHRRFSENKHLPAKAILVIGLLLLAMFVSRPFSEGHSYRNLLVRNKLKGS